MKPQETVCFHFKAIWHAISRMYNEEGAKHGISAAVGYVLLYINEKEGTPATHIGPMIGMEARSLTRMLKNLEEENLIYRESDKQDRRIVRIFLTEQGKEKKQIAKRVVKRFNTVLRQEIPEKKLAVFFDVAGEINNIIERKNIF